MPAQKTCRQEEEEEEEVEGGGGAGAKFAKDTLRQKSTARDRTLTFRRP